MTWRTLLAIDLEPRAVQAYALNFPDTRVECGPVADWIDRLPDADVLLGGPPCQPFSLAGKGEGDDDERDCIPDFLAAVRKVRPRMFLMENVPGLLTARHKSYIGGITGEMEAAGYHVDVVEQDAYRYGVPQFRNRVWFWGIRDDVYAAGARQQWPKPTHQEPASQDCMFGGDLLPWVTVRQALGIDGWLRAERGQGMCDRHGARRDTPTDEPAPLLGAGSAGSGPRLQLINRRGAGFLERGGQRRAHPVEEPSPTINTTYALGGGSGLHFQTSEQPAEALSGEMLEMRQSVAAVGAGPRINEQDDGQRHSLLKLRSTAVPNVHVIGAGSNPHFIGEARTERDITDEPSTTIACGDRFGNVLPVVQYGWSDAMLEKHPPADPDSPAPWVQAKWFKGGAEGLLALTKWKQKGELWVRRLSPLECARLQSMPDDYRWPAGITKTAAYRIVGNGQACGHVAHLSRAFKAADPKSETVIDLFCGGGLGACGWHQRYWRCPACRGKGGV